MRLTRRQATAATVAALATVAAPPAGAQPGDEAAVARAVDAFRGALLSYDRAQLEALLAPELSYGHSSGKVESRQEFIDGIMSRSLAPRSIELSDRRVTVVGHDAIVRHNFTADAVDKAGQAVPIRIGVMEVWQKRGDDWVMLAHQAYPRRAPG